MDLKLEELKKQHDEAFHDYDHTWEPSKKMMESLIDITEQYLGTLERAHRNEVRRVQDLEASINRRIALNEEEDARTAFDDRNDAEAKRLCHAG